MIPRCVKCPGLHHWKQCTIRNTETSTAFCHNCSGKHPATYKNCPILLNYLEKRNNAATQKYGPQENRGNVHTNNTVNQSTSTHIPIPEKNNKMFIILTGIRVVIQNYLIVKLRRGLIAAIYPITMIMKITMLTKIITRTNSERLYL